jgi:antibiotic biosynthesis monooxygenase (ABM) superfamily enzyme
MRSAGIAATAATLNLGSFAEGFMAEEQTGNVFHVFAFQWKTDVTQAQKDRAAKDIAAFQGQIPGLLETHVGPNISPRGKGFTFGGVMRFKDQAFLDAYTHHPSHLALLAWLVPLIDAIELDLRS